ncbi:helix-turn-helix domain-containing protein [Streptomyces sp. NPDC002143]
MKGLLLRLSALDADAAAALRVIAHYEGLLGGGRIDAESLVRSTASLAECPAGLLLDGRVVRFSPSGAALPGEASGAPGGVEFAAGSRVWLERDGEPGPLDELVLEWMGIAAAVLTGHRSPAPSQHVADPALLERVLSEREAVEDRARALRLLGLDPAGPLRVVVVDGPAAVATLSRHDLWPGVRAAGMGSLVVALVPGAESPASDLRAMIPRYTAEGVHLGIGGSAPALAAGDSWVQARLALRFAVAGSAEDVVVDYDQLGPLALLAELPVDRLRTQPDVVALEGLAEPVLTALATFCRAGTLRQAAVDLHLHHSSVAARLAQAEAALNLRLADPADRFRAQFALYAHRLSRTGRAQP